MPEDLSVLVQQKVYLYEIVGPSLSKKKHKQKKTILLSAERLPLLSRFLSQCLAAGHALTV